MLTPKQNTLYQYLVSMQQAGLVSPTFDEMAAAIGLKSKSGIARLLDGLEERGFVQRHPQRARSIHVLRLPIGNVCPHCGKALLAPVSRPQAAE